VVLSFAHTLGEFGVVLMVGGNLPGVTRTVSIDIYDRAQSLDYAGASHTALLLLLISFAILSAVYGINRSAGGARCCHGRPSERPNAGSSMYEKPISAMEANPFC